jgi:hypothetical protein
MQAMTAGATGTVLAAMATAATVAALAGQALAQQACVAGEAGRVPDCMVGTWTGESDMAARFDAMMATMPASVRAQATAGSAHYLFLRVDPDGWFVTSPLAAAADATFLSDSGAAGTLRASLETSGGTGFFTAGAGDAMSFCMLTGGWGKVTLEGGEAMAAAPVARPATSPVPMRWACSGDSLKLFVDLPPPMGTVTYGLSRIPDHEFPAALLEVLPLR